MGDQNKKDNSAITAALNALWVKYLPDISEKVNLLNTAADAAASGNLDENLCAAARGAAHKLAGTLGTFGLARGTELARELEIRYTCGAVTTMDTTGLKESALIIRAMIESRE